MLTSPTVDLTDVMMRDSGHIQESDAEFVNKETPCRGEPLIEPLYTQQDAEAVADQFSACCRMARPFEPVPGVTALIRGSGAYPRFGRDFAGN